MKSYLLKVVVVACLTVSGVVGCGPEAAVLIALTTQTAAVVGGVAGTVWLIKNIENVSMDTEKKRLEIQAIQNGQREVHEVDLSDDQVQQIKRTGRVRLGDSEYRVH